MKIVGLIFTCVLCVTAFANSAKNPLKVFILAGDEYVLENGIVGKADQVGTLENVVKNNPKYAFLKADNKWVSPKDLLIYDSHPIFNNTKAEASPVKISCLGLTGRDQTDVMGVTAALGHRLADAIEDPVLIIRHGVHHETWFQRGSRNLIHDYRPPSIGGGADHAGSWDVIHFNHGIHDTGYRNPKKYAQTDENKFPIYMPIDQYEKNLRTIVARLKKTGATLIWARITPVLDEHPGYKAADIDRYNAVADQIMKENGVIINDLYAESIRLGYPKKADVHSVGKLSSKVTAEIEKALAARKNNTKPLPRVLLWGDSISGSYTKEVRANFDGKAYICKNPGNAGPSNNGVENMEMWLNLKSYLLNGQEYLQLVSGVREALANLDRVCPQYADRKAEIAGLIWFQGHADGLTKAKAEVYEKHLACLLRDLRKDLKTPKLPIVVTAVANGKQRMVGSVKQVFDAQMAVGNAQLYPEFAGNVLSVDTSPMIKDPKQSPGGRDYYKGNANSYLEIGEAMAEAILKLAKENE